MNLLKSVYSWQRVIYYFERFSPLPGPLCDGLGKRPKFKAMRIKPLTQGHNYRDSNREPQLRYGIIGLIRSVDRSWYNGNAVFVNVYMLTYRSTRWQHGTIGTVPYSQKIAIITNMPIVTAMVEGNQTHRVRLCLSQFFAQNRHNKCIWQNIPV